MDLYDVTAAGFWRKTSNSHFISTELFRWEREREQLFSWNLTIVWFFRKMSQISIFFHINASWTHEIHDYCPGLRQHQQQQKKNGDEDRTAASSHLPNIKCKRKLLQKNQCPAPARDVHNHEPWQSVSALLFSLLFLFYLVLRITCLTFMLRSKSFNVCSVVHNFECRTNGKRNGRKSEIIENVDAYSCVDFVTSANIHTQDLFVLINKFQRFGFMQARSALVRVRLP